MFVISYKANHIHARFSSTQTTEVGLFPMCLRIYLQRLKGMIKDLQQNTLSIDLWKLKVMYLYPVVSLRISSFEPRSLFRSCRTLTILSHDLTSPSHMESDITYSYPPMRENGIPTWKTHSNGEHTVIMLLHFAQDHHTMPIQYPIK